MTLQDTGEFGLIKKISRGCLIRKHNVIKAIGDDAAVFKQDKDEVTLVTTDLLIERVHFLREKTSGFDLGHKSLAVNLSDIAAMGGTAREAFVSIGLPDNCTIDYIEDLYRGIKNLAGEFGVNILGGDTTASKQDLIINICVVGTAAHQEILFRDTAKPGDIIFSTGFLGNSKAGLHLIVNGIASDSVAFDRLTKSHQLPRPHLGEGRFLAIQAGVHAAIDVSDGLSSDICHIAQESDVGVCLFADKIPVSQDLDVFCNRFGFDKAEYALSGGEDYTLLCTVSPDKADKVAEDFMKEFKSPLYPLGEITAAKKMILLLSDGHTKNITPSGWDHFKKE